MTNKEDTVRVILSSETNKVSILVDDTCLKSLQGFFESKGADLHLVSPNAVDGTDTHRPMHDCFTHANYDQVTALISEWECLPE